MCLDSGFSVLLLYHLSFVGLATGGNGKGLLLECYDIWERERIAWVY